MATPKPKAARKRTPSPAQIAHQVTWRLEGDIKRNRLSSLSISVQLARVRDEKLWSLLEFDSIEKWALERTWRAISRAADCGEGRASA